MQLIADAALTGLELDELLEEMLERLREVFAADTCAVLLLEAGALVPRAAKGLDDAAWQKARIPLGEGFAGRVAAERRTILLSDVKGVDVVNPSLRERGLSSLLGTPLVVNDKVLGVVHVGRVAPPAFDAEDTALLELAAERVARALERASVHEELVRLDKLKRQFVAVASHELRTPATSVSGLAATLFHRRGQLEPEQEQLLVQTLYEQSVRLVGLTEQLLDLSRLDADVIEIKPQTLAVRECLRGIVATATGENAGSIAVDVAADLEAVVDPDALEHIVSNLLVNALRYGAPPISITATQLDRHFRLVIQDRGPGVDTAFAPRLFERFSRDGSPHDHGAGLGLAIARSYAQAHGGELLYQHANPHGARFELVLPRP